jgi:hypothetical protein
MIRAHLATFPPRAGILMRAVQSILPQVDRLCICLNGYKRIPEEIGDLTKVEAMIPETDLKDAGKFAFPVADDDLVFTIDDDIVYPPDHVERMLRPFEMIDPTRNVLGLFGNVFGPKGPEKTLGWRTFAFTKPVVQTLKMDVLGTGTTCQLGRVLPLLEDMKSSAGFVDIRHSILHHRANRSLWLVPHQEDALLGILPEDLKSTSLFETVSRARNPDMMAEVQRLYPVLTPFSGLKWEKVMKLRAEAG